MPLDETAPSNAAEAVWPEIDRSLLGDGSGAPPAFPLALLPPRWRCWIERSAQSFTPVDYVAQALLGTVSTACGAGVVVRVTPHWSEPLLLWLALVGGPSSGKSPALAAAWRLMDGLAPFEGGAASNESADSALPPGIDAAGPVRGADLPPPAIRDEAYLHPLLWVMRHSPRGVTLRREELGDWIAQARRGPDRAGWLAGWSAEAASAERRGSFGVEVERFPLTVLGGLSVDLLDEALRRGGDAGFASRLLFAWPGPVVTLSLDGEEADDESLRAMLRRISGLAFGATSPGMLPLEPEALQRLRELLPRIGRMKQETEGDEAAWIGKGAGTIMRLAGLLHLMRWTDSETPKMPVVPDGIDVGAIDAAWELWSGYYLPHAQRVFAQAGHDGGDRLVRRAARWLRRSRSMMISREDIRREALCQSVNAEAADQVIEHLETAGMVRPVASEARGRRGPLRRRWQVNPALR